MVFITIDNKAIKSTFLLVLSFYYAIMFSMQIALDSMETSGFTVPFNELLI